MIKIEDLSIEYKNFGKKRTCAEVLKHINLEIEEGEFFCLLGSSGCGKTTLLNILAGFIQGFSGNVLIGGRDLHSIKEKPIMMFQENALFPWLTVSKNIEFGMKMAGKPYDFRQAAVKKYLSLVNLAGKEDNLIHELSGGMKQRVALARALTIDSDILLMDEPFAALDQVTKSDIREELIKIWEKEKKTIVFVTHDIEEAIILADRIAVMEANPGRIKQIFRLERNEDERNSDDFTEVVEKIKELMRQ